MSLLLKLLNALYRNLPFPGILFMNSDILSELVILHLPFPVISSFFPRLSFFSTKVTVFPSSADFIPAIIPY